MKKKHPKVLRTLGRQGGFSSEQRLGWAYTERSAVWEDNLQGDLLVGFWIAGKAFWCG